VGGGGGVGSGRELEVLGSGLLGGRREGLGGLLLLLLLLGGGRI